MTRQRTTRNHIKPKPWSEIAPLTVDTDRCSHALIEEIGRRLKGLVVQPGVRAQRGPGGGGEVVAVWMMPGETDPKFNRSDCVMSEEE